MMKVACSKEEAAKITKAIRENDGYCPCRVTKTQDTRCPCKEFREMESGTCHCGLFCK